MGVNKCSNRPLAIVCDVISYMLLITITSQLGVSIKALTNNLLTDSCMGSNGAQNNPSKAY